MDELRQYIWFFVLALGAGLLVTPRIRDWAIAKNLLGEIRSRDSHKEPVPRLGGLAIASGFWLVVFVVLLFWTNRLDFVEQKVWGIDKNFLGVMIGSAILIGTMLADDIKGLKWSYKLIAQLLAAMAVVGFGITIHWFSNPFGNQIDLSGQLFQIGDIVVTWGQLVAVVWIIFMTNIINWLDGLDGLAGGVSVISLGILFLLAINPAINQGATAMLAIILIGSILGFLPYNLSKKKIFMGDTGSMFIGFMLAIIAIISGGKVATASLVLGLPILDGLYVVGNRLWHKKSIFEADKNHIFHRLQRAGLTAKQTVIVLYMVSVLFGYFALRSGTEGKFMATIWLIIVMAVLSAGLIVIEWRKSKKIQNSKPKIK